ncbi:MAG: pirin family protein [Myxococcales bacterium]
MTSSRDIANVVRARATSDGAGVRLMRTIGTPELDHLDPFLMLDEFKSDQASDYIAGFPDHPHRGFETVTYMLAGHMEHRDHIGNRGDLAAGSVQWMTAGRGIVHSEMPRQEQGLMWGFQLWVNLPARDKMCEPRYQDIPPDAVPEVALDGGGVVRVIAGEHEGTPGAVGGIAVAPTYLDVRLPAEASLRLDVPASHQGFVYVYEGEGHFGGDDGGAGTRVSPQQLGVLGEGEHLQVEAGSEGVRFLLVAGKPIREPIARYGPFVMNTKSEILRAVQDFQSGRFG